MFLEVKLNKYFYAFYRIKKFISLHLFSRLNKESTSNSTRYYAVERIMKDYGNSILRIAMSYMKNIDDAEDVLQDTLIQYYKKAPEFESQEHEKAWIIRVAINLCKNQLKKKNRDEVEINEEIISCDKESLEYVWEAVKQLPVKYREVIHLYYHEGYSAVQIADLTSSNDSTVRSLLHRARKILKDILKGEYDFEE